MISANWGIMVIVFAVVALFPNKKRLIVGKIAEAFQNSEHQVKHGLGSLHCISLHYFVLHCIVFHCCNTLSSVGLLKNVLF